MSRIFEHGTKDSSVFRSPALRVSSLLTLLGLALLLLLPGEKHLPDFSYVVVAQAPPTATPLPTHDDLPDMEALTPNPTVSISPIASPVYLPEMIPDIDELYLDPPDSSDEFRTPVVIARAPVPFTTIPDRPRLEVITYTVQAGDTVFGIANRFGISPETIMWSNGNLENHPDDLSIGQVLAILPVSGVYHKVVSGNSVESLAKTYKVEPSAILEFHLNEIDPEGRLTVGQMLVVPDGKKPYVPRRVSHYSGPIPTGASKGTGRFGWPTTGRITQTYWSLHRAIDIGAPTGTGVVASDSGYVAFAGWDNGGYGNLIIIDHGNGYVTYYAHLSTFNCKSGDSVAKGQRIGAVGSTGRSTGPHLHFEIRQGGVQRNPLGFLP